MLGVPFHGTLLYRFDSKFEFPAVYQPGQGIVLGLVGQDGRQVSGLGHIMKDQNDTLDIPLFVADWRQ